MIPLELALVEPLGRLTRAPGAERATGVHVDSRRVGHGDLFVAAGRNGTSYVDEALARGAAAALVPGDVHAALATIAGAVRARSEARVVAISGSFGKTTTKDVLAALCAPHARTVSAEASYNNELGVPLTLCRLEPDTEICVLELAMRGPGQLSALAGLARPHLGVVTNVGIAHLELLGSLERVAAAKAELLAHVEEAVLPVEPLLDQYVPAGLPVRRFSSDDVLAFDDGRAVFRIDGEQIELHLNMTMRHNAVNALAAVHAYLALGLPPGGLQRGADRIAASPWHGEELPLPGGGILIADCWNANPVSMRGALEHARRVAGDRRLVAVLGGMAELGPDSPDYHREIGSALYGLGVAQLVAVGELARGYLGANGVPASWVPDATTAVEATRAALQPDDVVLVKGSRSVGLELVAKNLSA